MANYIEAAGLSAQKFVTPTSRYADAQTYYYSDKKLLTFETYKRPSYLPNQQDQYWIIEKGYEFRPDLVSNRKYGTPDFWWKILEANGMKDIMEFVAGTNIVLPNL